MPEDPLAPSPGEDPLKELLARLGGDETELEIYRVVRSLPEGPERDAYLREACGDDASLRARVQTLLDHPVPEAAPALPPQIGPYRIHERIGQGGMGDVYSAEQVEPVRRRVALKVIKLGMGTREIIARFESERQALALMNHPGIASMIDAGSTPDGRPYFVMEHVPGVPITTYCDRRSLPMPERLRLFERVCAAVQHAHQKGVIHRDLKPSNILVGEEGGRPVPKVIDFGIAKATGPRLTDSSLFTEVGRFIGTPEYMSPEQAEATSLDVDTRADVYALGVVLYELVCGLRPFDFRGPGLGLLEIRRTIVEDDPPAPSARLEGAGELIPEIAEARSLSPQALRRAVRGELDSIAAKAMDKIRSRRYATAEALAQDVANHRQGRPVSARPDTLLYRVRKLSRRHRVASASAAIVLALIVAFGAAMAVQANLIARARDRANHEAEVSREVADFLAGIFQVTDPARSRGEEVTAREVLDAGVREIDERMPEATPVRAKLKYVMGSVYENLGIYPEAAALLEDALETGRAVNGPDHPETLDAMNRLGGIYFSMDRLDEAEQLLQEALAGKRRIYPPESYQVLMTVNNLANVYYQRGNLDRAGEMYQEAYAISGQVNGPQDRATLMTAINLANVRKRQHDPAEARRLLQEAYDGLSAQDGEDDPTVLGARYLLATTAAESGDLEGALADLEAVLRTRERVLGPDHPETMWTRVSLAAVLEEQGDVRRAEEIYRDSIERRQRVLGDGHTDTARARSQLADLLVKNPARQQEARPLLEAALSTYQEVLGEENLRTHDARVLLALLAERRGDHPEADRQLRTALGHGFDRSVLDGLGADVRADLLAVAARVDPVAE